VGGFGRRRGGRGVGGGVMMVGIMNYDCLLYIWGRELVFGVIEDIFRAEKQAFWGFEIRS
jgi:hypothetical protein